MYIVYDGHDIEKLNKKCIEQSCPNDEADKSLGQNWRGHDYENEHASINVDTIVIQLNAPNIEADKWLGEDWRVHKVENDYNIEKSDKKCVEQNAPNI